jgi:hypothetical protein
MGHLTGSTFDRNQMMYFMQNRTRLGVIISSKPPGVIWERKTSKPWRRCTFSLKCTFRSNVFRSNAANPLLMYIYNVPTEDY